MAEVSGFVDPSTSSTGGFNFNSFLNSVGGSLNQWAINSLDRQINKDTSERGVIAPPEQKQGILDSFGKYKTAIMAAIAVGVAYLLFKQFKKGK